jgi:hypothetical protein
VIHVDRHPSRRQLAVFGLLWLVFFGVLGIMSWRDSGINGRVVAFWVLAVLIPSAGLFHTEIIRRIYLLAAYAVFPVGWTVSLIVLMVIYYLILTPVGLVLRLTGYDPMRRRFDRAAQTYWLQRKPDNDIDRYFKQF